MYINRDIIALQRLDSTHIVTFDNLGLVRTRRSEQREEVARRIIFRRYLLP